MGNTPHGSQLKQGFHKVLSLDFFFLININDLSDHLASNPELFADAISLFPVVENMVKSANDLISVLAKISTGAFQWKIKFSPDPTKQAQEVIFNQKLQNTNNPCLIFYHNTVSLTESQKHLRIVCVLDWILRSIWK